MNLIVLEKFRNICYQITRNIPSSYEWEMDERFNTPIIIFDKKDKDVILTTVSLEFDKYWESDSIVKPSKIIKKLINSINGIQPGQKVFASTEADKLILFAAWWPWNNDVNISLRIGMFTLKEKIMSNSEIREHLKEWFDL
ncbi:MAG: hypothetical protein SVZ03_13080 [Spirochaetota bacterium]|nr:hypothetical protein [Spirochaetota bacterium]